MTEERWLPIPGYEGAYAVSDQGRVRSVARVVTRGNGSSYSVREKIRLQRTNKADGYRYAYLCVGGVRKTFRTHRLMAMAFPELRGFGDQIDHINRNRSDNRLGNLRSATRGQNMMNTGLRSGNTSGIVGVAPFRNKWRARISKVHIGLFDSIADAVAARDRVARQLYGDFVPAAVGAERPL